MDFSGKRPVIIDPATGELVPVELFVGVLGASSYVYAEACPTRSCPRGSPPTCGWWSSSAARPALFVPDNLRSGVTTAVPLRARHQPHLPGVRPALRGRRRAARAGHPRDKAVVEANVLVAQRWILAALRHQRFFSLAELNTAIWALLPSLNDRLMKQLGVSRRQLFEQLDRPLLRPLPATRYELGEWRDASVNIDYHVVVEHNYYSVPYQLVHQRVEVRLTAATVEIFLKGRRIASHRRRRGRGQYATEPAHMPAAHRAHAEWTPSRLDRLGRTTGPATAELVTAILAAKPHPEQGYRACLGLMRLSKRHGAERMEAACTRARQLGAPSYRTVADHPRQRRSIGSRSRTARAPRRSLPAHANIRGRAYYTREETLCSLTPPSTN